MTASHTSQPADRVVLWDLDETLLATRPLLHMRHSKEPLVLTDSGAYRSIRLHAGVDEIFRRLRSGRAALVSSSPRWYVDQILAHHLPDVSFDVVVTYDDVANIKPDPEPLLLALELLGVSADEVVYIGDDLVDYEACRAAGVRFLGAGWADKWTFPSHAETLLHPFDLLKVLEIE